jgi:signal transduction histidine kinase
MTYRFRMSLAFCSVTTLVLLCMMLLVLYLYAQNREFFFRRKLMDKAYTSLKLLSEVSEVDLNLIKKLDKSQYSTQTNESIALLRNDHSFIYASSTFDTASALRRIQKLGHKQDTVSYKDRRNKESIGLKMQGVNDTLYMFISADDTVGQGKLTFLRISLLLVTGLGSILSFGLSWVVAGQILKPISRFRDDISRINIRQLDYRANEQTGVEEFRALAATFNRLVDGVKQVLEQQRFFLNSAAHELRTPLTSMCLQIEVLQAKTRTPEEYQELLNSLLLNMKQLTQLLNGLLDLSRADVSPDNIARTAVPLDEVILEIAQMIDGTRRGYRLDIRFASNLEDEDNFIVQANHSLLVRAFFNLAENACKYSENLACCLELEKVNGQFVVRFKDEGPGIAPENRERVFLPFYRIGQTQDKPGHGLGLALVKRIAELHGATITISDNKPRGTIFSWTFKK